MGKLLVIGVGHKARQGKDFACDYLMKKYAGAHFKIHIVHVADALYEELRNVKYRNTSRPLIEKIGDIYCIFDREEITTGKMVFNTYHKDEVPTLHAIFEERGITRYLGMDEKDSPMLQFWGTNYRRAQDGEYWVKRLRDKMIELFADNNQEDTVILIPDTRFVNEIKAVHMLGGEYIEIERWNQDGTRFYDTSRDPNHPSEVELDDMEAKHGIRPYALVKAVSFDIDGLERQVDAVTAPLFAKMFNREAMSEVA